MARLAIPDIIKDTSVITVFLSRNFPLNISDNGDRWIFREYKNEDSLVIKNSNADFNTLSSEYKPVSGPDSGWDCGPVKPFPLKPGYIAEDYPM